MTNTSTGSIQVCVTMRELTKKKGLKELKRMGINRIYTATHIYMDIVIHNIHERSVTIFFVSVTNVISNETNDFPIKCSGLLSI